MPTPRAVYFAQMDAYQRIQDEACESPGRETGGILVGRMFRLPDGLYLVIVAASGPGANADRRAHTYAPDTISSQRDLEAWRNHYRAYQVDYVGEWHKHPPGIRQPSSGDTLQVIDILSDDSYQLPYGIFTPLVTIESETFMLHGYYYPRETARPVPVACESVDGDIRELLEHLAALEGQAAAPAPAQPPPSTSRWGVDPSALRDARASMAAPVAEVIQPEDLPQEHTVIDLGSVHSEQGAGSAAIPFAADVPPFPAPPPADSIPAAPPLPGRGSREERELEQFCLMLSPPARVERRTRDDGGVWYRILFDSPLATDIRQIEPPAKTRQTSEGTVVIEAPDQEIAPAILEVQIDPGEAFPKQPPSARVLLSDGRRLNAYVERLFRSGWRSHIRLRDVLRALIDALTEPRAPQQLSDLLEFHGRLMIRQVEVACRSVADLCNEFNRAYSFQRPDQLGKVDPPEQGA